MVTNSRRMRLDDPPFREGAIEWLRLMNEFRKNIHHSFQRKKGKIFLGVSRDEVMQLLVNMEKHSNSLRNIRVRFEAQLVEEDVSKI